MKYSNFSKKNRWWGCIYCKISNFESVGWDTEHFHIYSINIKVGSMPNVE